MLGFLHKYSSWGNARLLSTGFTTAMAGTVHIVWYLLFLFGYLCYEYFVFVWFISFTLLNFFNLCDILDWGLTLEDAEFIRIFFPTESVLGEMKEIMTKVKNSLEKQRSTKVIKFLL